jgi:hypothetical protein
VSIVLIAQQGRARKDGQYGNATPSSEISTIARPSEGVASIAYVGF